MDMEDPEPLGHDAASEPPASKSATSAASQDPTLPAPPKPTADLIKEVLTNEPKTTEAIFQAMQVLAAGNYNLPPLSTIQSALSTRGEKFANKIPPSKSGKERRRTRWTKLKFEPKKAIEKKTGRKLKPSSKKKADEAAAKKALLEKQAQLRRVDDVLARPMSAYVLFGLSQRGILKKQKSTQDFKEAIKAVGERWMLLSDEDRAQYEVMAQADLRRSEAKASERAAAAKAAAEAQAAAEQAAREADAAELAAGGGDEDDREDEGSDGGMDESPGGEDVAKGQEEEEEEEDDDGERKEQHGEASPGVQVDQESPAS